MKIYIESNFVIPGLEQQGSMDLNRSRLTLRELLEELSERSPDRIEYVRSGAKALEDWEVDIRGVPYENYEDGLDTVLSDEDVVTIRIRPIGGG